MRRAVARGRVFPSSYSVDRRFGRLKLKSVALFPLMWVNADDQGRLCGDPEEIKYSVCPNVDHITKTDVPELLQDLVDNKLILLYDTPSSPAIQILDWWDPHRAPQWAWPSDYPPPEGWQDHLRYKKDAKTVEKVNWPLSGEDSGEDDNSSQVRTGNLSGERSGEKVESPPSFPQTPIQSPQKETGGRRGKGKRRGNSPETSGEKSPSPAPTGQQLKNFSEILSELTTCFRTRWGRVTDLYTNSVEPREPDPRESAQLRDLAKELSAAGGLPSGYAMKAFDEAAGNLKFHVSYVRGVLFDWLDIPRNRSP